MWEDAAMIDQTNIDKASEMARRIGAFWNENEWFVKLRLKRERRELRERGAAFRSKQRRRKK